MLEDFEFVSVVDGGGAIGDGSYPVSQKGLLGGDIDVLGGRLRPKPGASGERGCERPRQYHENCKPQCPAT
jgi:hypothetical protein